MIVACGSCAARLVVGDPAPEVWRCGKCQHVNGDPRRGRTIPCPSCGATVARTANTCPACGMRAPGGMTQRELGRLWVAAFAVLAVVMVLVFLVKGLSA